MDIRATRSGTYTTNDAVGTLDGAVAAPRQWRARGAHDDANRRNDSPSRKGSAHVRISTLWGERVMLGWIGPPGTRVRRNSSVTLRARPSPDRPGRPRAPAPRTPGTL